MTYSFTTVEREVLAACGGDAAKLQAAMSAGKLSLAAIIAHTAQQAADAQAAIKLGHKMSDKGCVTITGINGKWGVSLYPAQLLAVLDYGDTLRKYIAENEEELTKRGAATKAAKLAAKAAGKSPEAEDAEEETTPASTPA